MSSPSPAAAGLGSVATRPSTADPEPDHRALDGGSSLIRAARVFATRCHARQRRDSDGARFIEHPLEVARLLRGAGCSDVVVAAGLLHDVLETTPVSVDELRACFGPDVAELVLAVSDNAHLGSYRDRKERLREQVRCAGSDAAVLFAADKISKVRELNAALRCGRGEPVKPRREHQRGLQVEHYLQSLETVRRVVPRHPLVLQLAGELADCPLARSSALPAQPGR